MSPTPSRLFAALLCAGFLLPGMACKRKERGEMLAPGAVRVADEKSGVCMVDSLAVRVEPNKDAKCISILSLGEGLTLSGDSEKDASGREYLKVQLSDGKSGWASATGVASPAQVGAVLEDTLIHRRPDVLTATPKKVPFMTIVAIIQQREDWLQLVGEGRRPIGWVQKSSVAQNREDVTAALLAARKMRAKDGLDQARKLDEIIGSSPFPSSVFIQKLRDRAAMNSPAPAPMPTPEAPKAEGGGGQWSDASAPAPSERQSN